MINIRNYLDLFSGIGGFAYGAYMAGFKCDNHFFSEVEPYAIKVYQLRFPNAINLGDITKIDFKELKKKYTGEWVITGGFPCQDISIAGKGVGIDGKRSGLWFEMWRSISVLRPKYCIIENVGALISWFDRERRSAPPKDFNEGDRWSVESEQLQAIAQVVINLAEVGYDAEWQDIRAADMGAPHRRERIWVIAYPCEIRCGYRGDNREKRHVLYDKNRDAKKGKPKREGWKRGSCEAGSNTGVAYTSLQLPHRNRKEGGWRKKFTDCSRWKPEPSVGRLANGIPSRVDRLKGLGNAIIPQIAKMLFELCEGNL